MDSATFSTSRQVAEAVLVDAHQRSDRESDALPLIRSALEVFERREIWANYVGASSAGIGTAK